MALMPSIMSLFGSRPQATGPTPADPGTQQQQQQSAAQNPSVPSSATPASTGSLAAIPAAGTGDQSPLANFQDLWKADPNNNQQTPSLVPNFNLDPKGLMDAAKKVNFTQHIAPELVTKAMSGDAASFLEVINQAAQLGYANATAASGEIIKNSLGSAQTVLRDQVLPGAFRDQAITQAFSENNPIFSDPAVAPMLGMLKSQLAMKYPTAAPQELATMAAQYISGMSQKVVTASGGTITTKEQQNGSRFQAPPEQDWGKFFDA
jgi:hypothetical protein